MDRRSGRREDGGMRIGRLSDTLPAAVILFAIAAVAGLVHGGFSLAWAAGSDVLLDTLGERVTATFDGRRGLLVPIGVVKVAFAVAPLALWAGGLLRRRILRLTCWSGALTLVAWGGVNTVTGQLVLAGTIHSSGGFDRTAMIGHAWLWDPLFVLWGAAAAFGLLAARRESEGAVVTGSAPGMPRAPLPARAPRRSHRR